VVTRTVVPESPIRVEYELTAKGRALEDAIQAIGKWATRWISEEDLARNAGSAAAEVPRRQPQTARPISTKRRPRERKRS
jgi:hypothetical protein